jgi:hypothetical protein
MIIHEDIWEDYLTDYWAYARKYWAIDGTGKKLRFLAEEDTKETLWGKEGWSSAKDWQSLV